MIKSFGLAWLISTLILSPCAFAANILPTPNTALRISKPGEGLIKFELCIGKNCENLGRKSGVFRVLDIERRRARLERAADASGRRARVAGALRKVVRIFTLPVIGGFLLEGAYTFADFFQLIHIEPLTKAAPYLLGSVFVLASVQGLGDAVENRRKGIARSADTLDRAVASSFADMDEVQLRRFANDVRFELASIRPVKDCELAMAIP